MTRFYCSKCGYKFEKDKATLRCPYCSAQGTLHKERSAQELLDDIAPDDEE